jgi:hypothetical protein
MFALLAAGPVHAATLTVCPSGCDFTAIQPAVDSALSGDTIRISSGVFPGFVSITDKSLVLRGEGASRTVIDRSLDDPFPGSPIVILSCSRSFPITIQDLAITNTDPNSGQAGLANSGCKLKLKNSTVTGHSGPGISHGGSTLSIEDSVVAGNVPGISLESGTGTLIRSAVFSNATRGTGGGVIIRESGTLRVHRSTISNNSSLRAGGIFNLGKLVVTQSVITSNTGPFSSGGIENSGVATLSHSLIADNVAQAGNGGGIFNSGKLTLIDSTVLNNRASCGEPNCGRGGGIFNAGSAASASLIGSFITSNSALDGGGVFNEGGTVSQTDTLIINNDPNDCVGC